MACIRKCLVEEHFSAVISHASSENRCPLWLNHQICKIYVFSSGLIPSCGWNMRSSKHLTDYLKKDWPDPWTMQWNSNPMVMVRSPIVAQGFVGFSLGLTLLFCCFLQVVSIKEYLLCFSFLTFNELFTYPLNKCWHASKIDVLSYQLNQKLRLLGNGQTR